MYEFEVRFFRLDLLNHHVQKAIEHVLYIIVSSNLAYTHCSCERTTMKRGSVRVGHSGTTATFSSRSNSLRAYSIASSASIR